MEKRVIQAYLNHVKDTIAQIPLERVARVIDLIYQAYVDKKQVFIVGNGGSASTASHLACDLGKGAVIEGKDRLRVMSLNDNTALLTAYANDVGYSHVFAEQLKSLIKEGDLLICISGSGNSPNILKAIEAARQVGAVTVGLFGFGGGKAVKMVDEHVTVDDATYEPVEDVHLILAHAISTCFRQMVMHADAEHPFGSREALRAFRNRLTVGAALTTNPT